MIETRQGMPLENFLKKEGHLMVTDNKNAVIIAALCLLFLSYKATAGLVTFEFTGQKDLYADVFPALPEELYKTEI